MERSMNMTKIAPLRAPRKVLCSIAPMLRPASLLRCSALLQCPVLNTTIEMMPDNVEKLVMACVVLHNFIMLNDQQRWYCPAHYTDSDGADCTTTLGTWREEVGEGHLRDFASHRRRSSARALQQRSLLVEYFSNEGAVPFQPYIAPSL